MKGYQVLILASLLFSVQCGLQERYIEFKSYVKQFGKQYHSRFHELYRFNIYLQNQKEIQRLNLQQEGTAIYGQTQFTDLTSDQMKQYLGLRVQPKFQFNYVKNYTQLEGYQQNQDIPEIWNWVQEGAVSAVKNQGSCGSCWTFSTAGNIQSLNYLKTKEMIDLSEQQLIDCDKSNFGCNGGWPYNAIDWLSKNGGIMTQRDYPLRSNYSGPCQFKAQKSAVKVKGYMNVTHDQQIIKKAVYQLGPLSILLDFTGLFHYKGGVASPLLCSTWPDHALVLVGYGIKDEDYWLIKNSWGPKWGINGYLMLKRGKNKCGINLWATTAVLDSNHSD